MHCDIYATLLDAAGIPVPKMNGKNPVRGTSLMPHMLSSGKKTISDRSMIFELWGNIGLRKGDYKLWADVGAKHSPDWPALASKKGYQSLPVRSQQRCRRTKDLRTATP